MGSQDQDCGSIRSRPAGLALRVLRLKASPLGDARQHPGADLHALVEGKHKVRPPGSFKNTMRSGATLFLPANAEQGLEDAICFRRWPAAHDGR